MDAAMAGRLSLPPYALRARLFHFMKYAAHITEPFPSTAHFPDRLKITHTRPFSFVKFTHFIETEISDDS